MAYLKPKPLTLGVRHCVPMLESDRLRAAYATWRQEGHPARHALAMARADVEKGKTRYPSHHFDANPVDDDGGRYIENPDARGLRLEGFADDLTGGIDHKGWWMDPDGMGETARGIVYRLPARKGRAVFLAGYADPFNADSDTGRGPAYLSMSPIIADTPWPHVRKRMCAIYGAQQVNRMTDREIQGLLNEDAQSDAALQADSIAESMAEQEREYQEALQEGARAREVKRDALEAATRWKEDMRAVREFFAMRHAAPGPDARRSVLRTLVKTARRSCEAFEDARAKAHGLDIPPRAPRHGNARVLQAAYDAFWEGYENA